MSNWKILAEDKAKELHIKVKEGTLIINVRYIPKYMSVEKFLDYIQKKNIVISDEDIVNLNIPTGVPLIYELDENFKVLSKRYLGDQEAISKAMEAVKNQGKSK